MTAITAGPDATGLVEARAYEQGGRARGRTVAFWVVRYLPAEIAGTAALVVAGLATTIWTEAPLLIALAALIGEAIGFYGVLAVTIYAEQPDVARGWRRALGTTARLLRDEFGGAEMRDTLLVRPVALYIGVWLAPDPLWGLIAAKLCADVVFYATATATRRGAPHGVSPRGCGA